MLLSTFITLYLYFYYLFVNIWKRFFCLRGKPILTIYHLNDNVLTNITIRYYTNIGLRRYVQGLYYCLIHDGDQTNHISHTGKLSELDTLVQKLYTVSDISSKPKRRNIMLFNGEGTVVPHDLNVLDNYVNNTRLLDVPYLLPDHLFRCLGWNCTHVQIMSLNPFQLTRIPTSDLTIGMLYE